jgi:hypothetical protein
MAGGDFKSFEERAEQIAEAATKLRERGDDTFEDDVARVALEGSRWIAANPRHETAPTTTRPCGDRPPEADRRQWTLTKTLL